MKFEIDTEAKTIKLESEVPFTELVKTLKDLLGKQVDKYKVIPNTTINYYPYYPYNYPWTTDRIIYTDNTNVGLQKGEPYTYPIEDYNMPPYSMTTNFN